jgi:hypothetical protein
VSEPAAPRRYELPLGVLAAAFVGLLVGVLGTFKHQVGVSAATGAGFPTGLLLSLAMIAALLLALRLSFPSRAYSLAAAGGVVVAVFVLSMKGPGGSVVVIQNLPGVIWTVAPAIVAAVVVGAPRIHRGAGRPPGADGILGLDPPVVDPSVLDRSVEDHP